MRSRRSKIMCTLGPASMSPPVLRRLEVRGADYLRINLSHTPTELLEPWIQQVQSEVKVPLVLDTDGPQPRTGFVGPQPLALEVGSTLRLYDKLLPCTPEQIYVRPEGLLDHLERGDLISVDFDNVLLQVVDISTHQEKFATCRVMVGGTFGSNRAVTVEGKDIDLPTFSPKDLLAFEVAKHHGIRTFTLSFVGSGKDVKDFRRLCPGATAIAKVETRRALGDLDAIIREADGILIDRGDLGREIPAERVPLMQRVVVRRCRDAAKPVLVATSILENMTHAPYPTRAEVQDIFAGVLEGVSGFVLTKETAIGKYPVETLGFLDRLCEEAERALQPGYDVLQQLGEISAIAAPAGLVDAHGGRLVDRMLRVPPDPKHIASLPRLDVDEATWMDAEQIAIGAYSPLTGFMSHVEVEHVLDRMRLPSGEPWTVPIILQLKADQVAGLKHGDDVVLQETQSGQPFGLLRVDDVYSLDQEAYCRRLYGTTARDHPGVDKVFSSGDAAVGGPIRLFRRRPSKHKHYELTPFQTRQIFARLGWSRIVGFHTRNPPHRSHEFIQAEAVRRVSADGLLIQPIVGRRKPGDFTSDAVLECYKAMETHVYPKGSVVVAAWPTHPRYAGPREAVFTAICRKNFGCSHFIVGRDHTGVGSYYAADASHHIFDKFPDLGIQIVRFGEVAYCEGCASHVEVEKCPHGPDRRQSVSGTGARRLLNAADSIPDWLVRPEVRAVLRDMQGRGERFLEA